MFKVGFLALAIAVSPLVKAASPVWGQCGGIGFSGDTSCVIGAVCTKQNDYYFQCLPGAATPAPAPTTTAPEAPPSATIPTTTAAAPTSAPAAPAPTGFVSVSGQKFTLNGSPFTVVGENAYWMGLMGYSVADMNKAFADIASSGATVVRTLGFNEVTVQNGIFYQSWDGATPTVNIGPSGLQNFDNVVATAKANGLRLIVSLTNNWSDYGGMDVYVKQILNSPNHDLFYTDAKVNAAYKAYVKTFVTRYVDEPTIMAWELANEPRCRGSTGVTTGTCTTVTITNWIKDLSAFIKTIDKNHLVAVGDEGFFNDPTNPSYPYQGSEGVDFNANLAVSTIDFGTFHTYPESWGQSANPGSWGSQWVVDHVASQKSTNKPVIMEEFGVTSNQPTVYSAWFDTIETSGLAGDLIWQAGSYLSTGDTPNDGYAEYPDGSVFPLLKQHSAALKART